MVGGRTERGGLGDDQRGASFLVLVMRQQLVNGSLHELGIGLDDYFIVLVLRRQVVRLQLTDNGMTLTYVALCDMEASHITLTGCAVARQHCTVCLCP